jgi:hypothetical protein
LYFALSKKYLFSFFFSPHRFSKPDSTQLLISQLVAKILMLSFAYSVSQAAKSTLSY